MKLKVISHNRKIYIFVVSILILLLAYIVLKFSFPGFDLFSRFLSYITRPYLLIVEKFANIFLRWRESSLSIKNHGISLNDKLIEGFTTQIMYKKVTIFYILTLWLTRATSWKKICFTAVYLVLNFLSASFYIVTAAFSVAGYINNASIILATHGIVFFCMNTAFLVWYLINKKFWSDNSSNISSITKLLERKLLDIIIILYGYSIVTFSLGYFKFRLYISFLLKSSQGILGLLGYDAIVKPYLLIGNNGSISVYRTCLGFMTMFLFAALVYLTDNDLKRGWRYIIFGVLILNLLNILRIVLLFIHIQKHGDYILTTDVHDLYNYIFYFIVFVLWVIWFERLMDQKTLKSIKSFLKE
jgi:exosortase/archaeosortase family protein